MPSSSHLTVTSHHILPHSTKDSDLQQTNSNTSQPLLMSHRLNFTLYGLRFTGHGREEGCQSQVTSIQCLTHSKHEGVVMPPSPSSSHPHCHPLLPFQRSKSPLNHNEAYILPPLPKRQYPLAFNHSQHDFTAQDIRKGYKLVSIFCTK